MLRSIPHPPDNDDDDSYTDDHDDHPYQYVSGRYDQDIHPCHHHLNSMLYSHKHSPIISRS